MLDVRLDVSRIQYIALLHEQQLGIRCLNGIIDGFEPGHTLIQRVEDIPEGVDGLEEGDRLRIISVYVHASEIIIPDAIDEIAA